MLERIKEYHLTLFSQGEEIDCSFLKTFLNFDEMTTPEIVEELKLNSLYNHKFLDRVDNITSMRIS